MNEFGEYTLLLALFVAAYAMVVPLLGVRSGSEQLIRSGEYAALSVFVPVSKGVPR